MLYIIYTALIFEIIIAITLVIVMVKFDKRVNTMNNNLLENRHKIREFTRKIRNKIGKLYISVNNLGENIKIKRNRFLLNILKKFVITLGIRLFLKKYKKQLIYAELILIAYETMQNCMKA